MERFSLKTRVIWGADALEALGELAGRRVLVVSDGFLTGSGLIAPVLEHLRESTVTVFDGVSGEPTLPMVAQGVEVLRRCDAETVVAFGGGSAMDCAKGMVHCAGTALPLWCIPTTAGTGSEVTAFAVLTDPKSGLKYPLVREELLPETALLDSRFLTGVPAKVTADTGMDVLTHGIEAFVAAKANPFTDALAERAVTMAYAHLPAAFAGEAAARETMLLASNLAGIAFNAAGLGVCHALAHALGARLHAPHGKVNAILLPRVIEANSAEPETAKRYAGLARRCGLSPTARALAGGIRRLGARLGYPERLPGSADLRQVALDAMQDPCMVGNVRTFTVEELEHILREAVG